MNSRRFPALSRSVPTVRSRERSGPSFRRYFTPWTSSSRISCSVRSAMEGTITQRGPSRNSPQSAWITHPLMRKSRAEHDCPLGGVSWDDRDASPNSFRGTRQRLFLADSLRTMLSMGVGEHAMNRRVFAPHALHPSIASPLSSIPHPTIKRKWKVFGLSDELDAPPPSQESLASAPSGVPRRPEVYTDARQNLHRRRRSGGRGSMRACCHGSSPAGIRDGLFTGRTTSFPRWKSCSIE